MEPELETEISEKDSSRLKIDTVWSEAEENVERFAVKEEIVSDIEPDLVDDYYEELVKISPESKSEENVEGCESDSKVSHNAPWQVARKNLKNKKDQRIDYEQLELSNNVKSSCLHDMKNFKIVNRRLRCGNCRSLVCPECFKIMFSTLHNHFLGFDTNQAGIFCCKFCSFPFQSVCALQAHIRIHTMETPYVCPDCGLIYSNAYFLVLHLINKCFHVYKIASYKCLCSPSVYFSSEAYSKHIQDLHFSCIYRCSYCSLVFNSAVEFETHIDSSHQKQKVQHLNYFRCTLCSGMVIPSFMYEKHVARHRENSESYEMEYQCLCGDVFSLIGAFRAHIQFCSKKGILPPRWGFLKKNLKNQNVMFVGNAEGQETDYCAGVNIDGARSDRPENLETDHTSDSIWKEVQSERGACSDGEMKRGEKSGGSNEWIDSTGKKYADMSVASEGVAAADGEEEWNKLFYDYIPCDHMGYVKNQGRESDNQRELAGGKADVMVQGQPLTSSSNCRVVMELDEKTGLMMTKNVFCEKTTDEIGDTSEGRIETDALNRIGFGSVKLPPSERTRLKLSTSFFTCPFCSVLFPKHSSTFQQFRLHLEYYHGNAALNITVTKEDLSPEKVRGDCCRAGSPKRYTGKSNEPAVKSQGSLVNSAEREWRAGFRSKRATSVDFGQGKSTHKTDGSGGGDDNCKYEVVDGNEENESGNVGAGLSEGEEKITENDKNDLFWTLKLSLEAADPATVRRDMLASQGKKNRVPHTSCGRITATRKLGAWEKEISINAVSRNEASSRSRSRSHSQEVGILRESQSASCGIQNNVAAREKSQEKNEDNVIRGISEEGGKTKENKGDTRKKNGEKVKEKKKEESDNKKGGEDDENVEDDVQDHEEDEDVDGDDDGDDDDDDDDDDGGGDDGGGGDFDDDWNYSKASSWSNVSDVESVTSTTRDRSMDLPETESCPSAKTTESKSRRESEVWSEFYESLQLAERLKNGRKKKESSLQADGDKKGSSLVKYSTKRVVKKPKRYRESSASECTPDEAETAEKEEGSQVDEVKADGSLSRKKELLLKKLKSVDQKVVDYLFDLVSRKERCFEVFKKHTGHGHRNRLRSYRSKILNGIKMRGRPQRGAGKGDRPDEVGRNMGQRRDWEGGAEERGATERRRGRPRKLTESGKVRERRRLNREVDFIEKNFERVESASEHSKRKRKLSSKLQYYKKISLTEEKEDFSSGQVISGKSGDFGRKLGCAVCEELFQDQKDFRDHIVSHRLEENTYQCMECGECFVVKPSLEKHLHAFHKIRDTEEYIVANECCPAKKEPGGDPESETLRENQCKVCRDQFERAVDLTKHFRIHGMAFLKEFRRDGRPTKP